MGSPLTTASQVQCGHFGTVAVSSAVKLTVGGNLTLLQTGVATKSVVGCATVVTPGGNKPCITVLSILPPSLALKLTAGGQPVVLDSLVGVTDGVPPGSLTSVAGQTKLTAV